MATFKSINRSKIVDGKFSSRKTVYLESDDDQAIFERWFFKEGEFIEFKSSNDGVGGGCTRVDSKVREDRAAGISAFGIVDRDALMQSNEIEILFDDNNENFVLKNPFGPHVLPLLRWEIENYVLNIKAFKLLLKDYGSCSPLGIKEEDLSWKMLKNSEALVPVMASNIALHSISRPALPKKYGLTDDLKKIESDCMKRMNEEGLEDSFKKNKKRILRFKSGENSTEEYWSLNRIIDGKRLIERLNLEFSLKEDHRFNLARIVREEKLVDKEVEDLIYFIKESE